MLIGALSAMHKGRLIKLAGWAARTFIVAELGVAFDQLGGS